MATLKYKDPDTGEIKSVITNIVNEGGSGLPAVSSADNGKILRVVEGQWAVIALPSAEEVEF